MTTPTTPAGIPTLRRQRRPLVRRPWTLAWNVMRLAGVLGVLAPLAWAFSYPMFWNGTVLPNFAAPIQFVCLVMLAALVVTGICHIYDKAQEEQRS